MQIAVLLREASRLGARGIEVVGWNPPITASSSEIGTFITVNHNGENISCSETPWYLKT